MKKVFLFLVTLISFHAHSQNCVGTAGQVKWNYWAGFTSLPDSSDLYSLEYFPTRPDGFQIMGSTQSPINYTDNFASMMRGYISVPSTDNYKFNVTGDDRVRFYLSTDDSPLNKIKRAETTIHTGITEYNKQASQTSQVIQLVGGQNYYFELHGFEGAWSDHSTLYWRKPSSADTTWRIIDFNFIKDYNCPSTCPPRGTACNDGNSNTTNDQQDGLCNCVGNLLTTNACVGARGITEAYYYDNLSGGYIEPDLISAPRFPLQPHRKELLKGAYGPLLPHTNDNYGTLVQGFLTVPVSGNYEFNLTGDNQTFFFLSKNDSLQYKQTSQAIVFYGVDDNEHTNSVFQSIGPLAMEKGKYYYFEFRHKDNTWRDHFSLFWKTPFHQQKTWKKIPNFYLFDYKCELACIPQGTPCNDGNSFTNNDQYDNNCQCIGTPCSGPNCNDAAARYAPYETCAPTKNLVPDPAFSWLSCASTANPNTGRTATKWIKYDLGDTYLLKSSRIWNYNVLNQTNKGFKSVVIDYSMNGTNWTAMPGTYTWPQASGASDYAGFIGPNFGDIKAKYILISSIDNWGSTTCSGFSKITFDVQMCNGNGTTCDDGDPLSMNDVFDANCNCKGVRLDCFSDTLNLGQYNLSTATYQAKKRIETNSIVPNTQNVSFTAGNSIVFMPGFQANAGVFKAEIKNCIQTIFAQEASKNKEVTSKNVSLLESDSTNANLKKIIFKLNEPSIVTLTIKDSNDNILVTLIDDLIQTTGTQIKYLPTNKLSKGSYWIELKIKSAVMREELIVN